MSCQNFETSNIASSPPFTMATPTNASGNLVDEFEEAFQSCLNVLTKEEVVSTNDKEEIRVEVEQTALRFIDLARQMEAFFLQKRFLLSALKPEMVVKEDVNELRTELSRKEELLKRHYEKIVVWQNCLADMQISNCYAKSPAQGGGSTPNAAIPNGAPVPPPPMSVMSGTQPVNQMVVPGMPQAMQQQMQAQQLQMQQQQQLQAQLQQQQQMLQQQMQVNPNMGTGPGMVSPQQAMFMQQGLGGARGAFSQQGPGGVLQGPLAYLEKTTSNIGMTDGRR